MKIAAHVTGTLRASSVQEGSRVVFRVLFMQREVLLKQDTVASVKNAARVRKRHVFPTAIRRARTQRLAAVFPLLVFYFIFIFLNLIMSIFQCSLKLFKVKL